MSSFTVDTSSPVLVTGATGYVAGVLIKQLLEQGVTVHGTVRDPSKKDRLQYLQDEADKSKGHIKFFRGNLTEEGSFEEGMKGCSVVFHTASPFSLSIDDPQKQLIEPAVEGTKNVLNTATKVGTVKRVVLTSSCAAIYTDAIDCQKAPDGFLTEDIVNMTSSLEYQPYSFSKTMAELTAWQIAGSQNQWTMATINPVFVLGPGLKYHASSESFKTIVALGGGQMSSGVPNLGVGVVDVRDVAKAHIAAAYKEGVTGRHILCGYNTSFFKMAQTLKESFPDYPIPTSTIPKTLLWLIGPYVDATFSRRFVSNNVDVELKFNNTKSKQELGIDYIPMEQTMKEMFQQIIDSDAVEKK